MKKIFLIVIFFNLIISCKSSLSDSDNDIVCVKFIENYNTFSVPIYYKNFWNYKDYHVKYKFKYKNFFNEIESMDNVNDVEFDDYTFCFVTASSKDTIYSNKDLNLFYLKNKDQVKCINKDSNVSDFFSKYSFFKKCW